jgi:hypothetical protein
MDWYYALNGKQQGPVSDAQIRELIQRGVLRAADLVWCQNMAAWAKVQETPALAQFLLITPPPVSEPPPSPNIMPSDIAQELYGGRDKDVTFQPEGPSRYNAYDRNRPRHVKTYLVESILVTLFCCMPFGVAAIIFAAQASGAVSSGNYEKAESLAGQAKNYVTIAVIIGLLINVIGFIFGFVGAVSQ